MSNVLIVAVAILFGGMGVLGCLEPRRILAPFGIAPTTVESRNEVRAVYGGFGIAVAVLLVAAAAGSGGFRNGVLVTVAAALAGMAVGRVIGFGVERPTGFHPTVFFLVLEIAMAGVLLIGLD